MDGSNSNVTELVEQLIDPSEKLLGYKVTKDNQMSWSRKPCGARFENHLLMLAEVTRKERWKNM